VVGEAGDKAFGEESGDSLWREVEDGYDLLADQLFGIVESRDLGGRAARAQLSEIYGELVRRLAGFRERLVPARSSTFSKSAHSMVSTERVYPPRATGRGGTRRQRARGAARPLRRDPNSAPLVSVGSL
jgi:hypothetical protein